MGGARHRGKRCQGNKCKNKNIIDSNYKVYKGMDETENLALSKSTYADAIYNKKLKDIDFSNFRPLLELIKEIIFN